MQKAEEIPVHIPTFSELDSCNLGAWDHDGSTLIHHSFGEFFDRGDVDHEVNRVVLRTSICGTILLNNGSINSRNVAFARPEEPTVSGRGTQFRQFPVKYAGIKRGQTLGAWTQDLKKSHSWHRVELEQVSPSMTGPVKENLHRDRRKLIPLDEE